MDTSIDRRQKPDARERIKRRGARHLSGSRARPVLALAESVVAALDSARPEAVFETLCAIDGMGEGKATAVMAALELGRRYAGIGTKKVQTAADVYPLVQHFADRKQEQFIAVSLNGAHEVLAVRVVSVGILNRTIVHPREVFGDPLSDRAAAVIVCHNHPSGQLEPSEEDRNVTRRLAEAGELLGVSLLDHLILSPRGGYFSFVESGIPVCPPAA
jgi:DNA repair protein RadC